MPPSDVLSDLELLLRSRYGMVHLDTREEDRARGLLRHVADAMELPFFTWSPSKGLVRPPNTDPVYGTEGVVKALLHVTHAPSGGLYHFSHVPKALFTEAEALSHLRDAVRGLEERSGALVFTGDLEVPASLRPRVATLRLPGPATEELEALLRRIVRDMAARAHVEVSLSRDETDRLLSHLSGLTLLEAEKILTRAIVEDGRLTADDIRHVIDAKREVVERDGLLEYHPVESAVTEVADLATLKGWLAKRKAVVHAPERAKEFGLDFPRGVLLLGVPGCGKSLSAKAVAAEWTLPLLKLDPSNLYNKYIGESERNFKRAMKTAEMISPVVLWIDELEKAFATGQGEDGGVSRRVLGSFLSWMQERTGDVFVVATANDIQSLPPEFLRKGRFDEIFFVDLPDQATREEIFRIHLEARDQDPDAVELDALAGATDGFSGSEIEQVVVAALYTVFSDGRRLSHEALAEEIGRTRPLSVTMAEPI